MHLRSAVPFRRPLHQDRRRGGAVGGRRAGPAHRGTSQAAHHRRQEDRRRETPRRGARQVADGAGGVTPVTVAITVGGTGLANGLIGWWRFDESPVTTTAVDSSATGVNGTILTGAGNEWAAGRVGGSVLLSGTKYVEVSPGPDLVNKSFTLSAFA